jgi:hypothetical protein
MLINKSSRGRTRMQTNPKNPRIDSLIVAIPFLVGGIALFDLAVYSNSQILCFMGLGLTFWGALFLLITPQKHVESSFLVASVVPAYMTIDRILKGLKTKDEAYNVPSYTREVSLPEYLSGLKEVVTFFPEAEATGMPAVEDLANGKFLCEKTKGFLIAPPGVALLERILQMPGTDLAKIPPSELDETLPELLRELRLSKDIEMHTNESEVILKINDSLYKTLYSQKYNLKSVNLLGCPMVSAAACAIAQALGKPTIIQGIKTTLDGKTTIATLKIIQS